MAKLTNEASLRRVYDEVFEKGRMNVLDEFMDRKFVEHEPLPQGFKPGIEGVKQLITAMRSGLPDLKVQVREVITQGDKVFAYATITGTHKGTFLNIPPTGKKISFEAMDLVRFSGGKAIEHWGLTDNLGILQQLGVVPEPGAAKK